MDAITLVADLDEVSERRLRLLARAADEQTQQPDRGVSLDYDRDHPKVHDDVSALMEGGLLNGHFVLSGDWNGTVASAGTQLLAKALKAQTDVVERRKFTRISLARWMLTQPSQSALLHVSGFLKGSPAFYGDPLGDGDVNDAGA